jgi:hypothetical protein
MKRRARQALSLLRPAAKGLTSGREIGRQRRWSPPLNRSVREIRFQRRATPARRSRFMIRVRSFVPSRVLLTLSVFCCAVSFTTAQDPVKQDPPQKPAPSSRPAAKDAAALENDMHNKRMSAIEERLKGNLDDKMKAKIESYRATELERHAKALEDIASGRAPSVAPSQVGRSPHDKGADSRRGPQRTKPSPESRPAKKP